MSYEPIPSAWKCSHCERMNGRANTVCIRCGKPPAPKSDSFGAATLKVGAL